MSAIFTCLNCHQERPVDSRQKGRQKYCGEGACQRARKATWQRAKLATDAAYPERQKACHKRWCGDKPLHQYQRDYRETHPDYVVQNRELQRVRNRKRREEAARQDLIGKIIKTDASSVTTFPSGIYEMRLCTMDASGKIVKMDAWHAQIQAVSAFGDTKWMGPIRL